MTRLRPILMTTVATVVGHFPLTLVTGAGAVARNSIGIVLVGGMSIGTMFTLFIVPSVYVLIAKRPTRAIVARPASVDWRAPPPGPMLSAAEIVGRPIERRGSAMRLTLGHGATLPGSTGARRADILGPRSRRGIEVATASFMFPDR